MIPEPSAAIITEQDPRGSDPLKSPFNQSILEFFRYLLRKWWLFVITGAVAGVLGIVYAGMQEINYESNLSFVLQQGGSGGGVSGALTLAAQFGLNLGGSEDAFSGDNILEIIKSRRIVEKVFLSVDSFNNRPYTLVEYFLNEPGAGHSKEQPKSGGIHFPPGQPRSSFSYEQDSLLFLAYKNFVASNINAGRPDKSLSIYSVKILSGNEKFTKIFTDRIIHETDSFYTEISSKKERETLEVLEQRVASMKGNLAASISSRAASQDANVNPAFAEAQVPLQKQQANIQVYGGAYAEMFKNLELARYQYLNKIPLIQIIDGAEYPMKKIKVSKLKTGLYFAIGAAFLLVILLWLKRIYRMAA
jgi:hypothetical protein